MKRLLTDIDCCCCFIAFFSVIQAIPVKDNSGAENLSDNRTALANVCVHENIIYRAGENFSTANPCETCVCDPPGVSCTLRSCDLKRGCKAIHKANRCCPEYVCECERNGKIYGNGEKVEEPNPCKVCYCKGGEIKCALVTCYTRDDCEPGYVAGVCCPKYDHCPPLEMKNNSTSPAPALVIVSDLKTESAAIAVKHETFTPAYLVSSEASTSYSGTEVATVDVTTVTEATTFFDLTTEANETIDADPNTTTEASTEFSTGVTESTDAVTTEEAGETTEMETTTEEDTILTSTTEEMRADIVEDSTAVDAGKSSEFSTTEVTEESTTVEANATEEFTSTEALTMVTEVTSTELFTTENYADVTERRTTTEPATFPKSVIKVIIPKTMKKDLEQVQKSLDGPAPIVVMISAEQIQFLKLAEEPPVYVENRDSEDQKGEQDHLGVVVVPKTSPTTVEMVKVVEATLSGDANATTEPAEPVHSSNSTDLTRER